MFINKDHNQGNETILNKCKRMEIIQSFYLQENYNR